MDIKNLHKTALKNKASFDYDGKFNKQIFIDSRFVSCFIRELNSWFDEYFEKNLTARAEVGCTEDIEYFTLTNRLLDNHNPFSESYLTSTVLNPFASIKLSNFPFYKIGEEYFDHSDITKDDYAVSIEGIKRAYDSLINKIRDTGVTIIHIDEFVLTEEEYHKLLKSLFKFEKSFAIKLSF